MRPVVDKAQKLAPRLPRLINPETAWGVWTMHVLIRMLSWTRVIFLVVAYVGKLFPVGPGAANVVPVKDYGFRNMEDSKDMEALRRETSDVV
jgi:hypothetical protein